MNPFIGDSKTREQAWKSCRAEITAYDQVVQQLDTCLKFWKQAPIENHSIDWDDASNWPSPWEQIQENTYCPSGHSLAVAYTLLLAAPTMYQDLALCLVSNPVITSSANPEKIVVCTQGWVLNWGYLDKTPADSLQQLCKHKTWQWTGKTWQQT